MRRHELALLVERGLKSDIIRHVQNKPQPLGLSQNIIQRLTFNGIIKQAGWEGKRVVWQPGPKFAGFLKQLTEMEGRIAQEAGA